MKIMRAVEDRHLFGPWFRDRETWQAWLAFLAALFGEDMTEEQVILYQRCTGRSDWPTAPADEAWLIIGRRGGKSFIMALVAVYLACFKDYRPFLAPGEVATVAVIASDRKQARQIMRYARAMLFDIPMLKREVVTAREESFDLKKQVTIEIRTASATTTRGYTYAAVLADEIAFWPSEGSASPDSDILDAIRPGMGTIPNSVLICASSPYARRGALWEAYRNFYGVNDAPLVWQAPTRTMNPTFRQEIVDKAMRNDPSSAAAEYGAQFRRDIEACVSIEAVDAVTSFGVHERGPLHGVTYFGFVDPSGGSADSMTLAIAHKERNRAVLDVVREVKPPFSPETVVRGFVDDLKRFRIRKITGDRYAGEWAREPFRKLGIEYQANAKAKSDLYRDLIPRVNSREVELLDLPRLSAQIVGLERRTSRGGRDSIDHAPGGHDDVANAVAGVLVQVFDRSFRSEFTGKTRVGLIGGDGTGGRVAYRDTTEPALRGSVSPHGPFPPAPPAFVAPPPRRIPAR